MTLTAAAEGAVLATVVLFCRIGACLMIMPGFASSRVPVQVRLFIAMLATLSLAPLLVPAVPPVSTAAFGTLLGYVLGELLTGATIGLMGRLFFLALQFLAAALGMMAGFATVSGGIEDGEQQPELATFIMTAATMLFFATDQHAEVLRALAASYAVLPVGAPAGAPAKASDLVAVLSQASLLALQVTAPFVVFSVLVNFLFGIVGKLVPQVPVAFVSVPFVLAGSLVLMLLVAPDYLSLFIDGFSRWLAG